MPRSRRSAPPIKVGVSSCLLGQEVRYDAGHKHDSYITGMLARFLTFVPVCPEIEVGMGVPREPVQLEGSPINPRMVGVETGRDWTARMNRYAARLLRSSDLADLSGCILKAGSPSCGMERVKVFRNSGRAKRAGVGLFAAALQQRFPLLPIEDESHLRDPRRRDNFFVRVFAYHRLQRFFHDRYSRGRLVSFHTKHKYLLMAHSPQYYRQLGRLVADIKNRTPAAARGEYARLFMEALGVPATPAKNANVLQHLLGYLKDHLHTREKQAIIASIENYRAGLAPLIVPLTLLRHYVELHNVDYLRDQVYLNPDPKELLLRNHV